MGESTRRPTIRTDNGISATVSTSANSSSTVTGDPGVAQGRIGHNPGVGPRHRHVAAGTRRSRRQPPRAPTSRRRGPAPAAAGVVNRVTCASVSSSALTCGVSIPICSTGIARRPRASACALASRSAKPSPRCPTTVKADEPLADRRAAARVVEVARHRDDARARRGLSHRVEGVEQGGRGNVGGHLVAQGRGKPSLGQPGNRGLGHHQNGDRQGSGLASRDDLPEVERGGKAAAHRTADLGLPTGAGTVVDIDLDHPPSRGRRHGPVVRADTPIDDR